MSESETNPEYTQSFQSSEELFSELVSIEAAETQQVLTDLRQEIARLECLGTDDLSSQSFHKIPGAETDRSVFFMAFAGKESSKIYQVIVNDLSPTLGDGRKITIKDYFFSEIPEGISKQETKAYISHYRHNIQVTPAVGPLLFNQGGRLNIFRGPNYKPTGPFRDILASSVSFERGMLRDMQKRNLAEEIVTILRPLSTEVSLEPGIHL